MKSILNSFLSYLDRAGVEWKYLDGDNTMISFSKNDIHYLFTYNANDDPYYIRIIIPVIDSYHKDNIKQLQYLILRTAYYKTGKFYVDPKDNLWIVSETFILPNANLWEIFERMMLIVQGMLKDYREEVKKGEWDDRK